MIKYDDEGYIILFETPKVEPPEFRLYYDDSGNLICYSCEKLEGNYIVIDHATYVVARPDVKVVDGKIVNIANRFVIAKIKPSDNEGIKCLKEDASIIANDKSKNVQKWRLDVYELQ
jgi:hypothetical protein